jgi:hypothetical protein
VLNCRVEQPFLLHLGGLQTATAVNYFVNQFPLGRSMQSPYAPPTSQVSDPPEPQHLFPKPMQIRVAVGFLWLLVVLAIPTVYFEYRRASSYGEAVFLTIFISAVLAFAAFLNVQISRGRNWARIVFLVIVAFSIAFSFLPDEGARVVSTVQSALSVASLVLDIVVAYLLFSWPGALWFRPRT